MLLLSLFLVSNLSQAQTPITQVHKAADKLTREMVSVLQLNEADAVQLYKYNRERFTKLATLQQQAAQLTQRQEDLKRSQLEQEYHERIFRILNAQQYVQYKRFKESRREFTQPTQVMASLGR
ncbi:hypothetical protein TH61_12110 [Rufibacter sp. DG15C]|uniref:hypothetical protein n=1 Tax=Rufibacter sp. DG15C TaxID=1379909 RepID=UPI00078D229D|nr:hypothetical protein [Rufibacter sp. DG15C]AMM51771.1 hypothetical protein TH61_12110 [Rufibacter sp. DG15C]